MPYTLNSPLSAGLAAATGVMAGQQDKKAKEAAWKRQQALDAQAQADTQARLGLEKSQQDATNAFRTTQVRQGDERLANERTRLGVEQANATRAQATADAAAAAEADKARRQKLIDTFQGQGLHYPKNWDTMKPEQKIAYLQVRLSAAQKAGDTKTVSNTETEINRVATQAEADRRQTDLDKQRGVQNSMGQQRINISIDRAGRADANRASAAGDPQSFADVSGRLAHAKTRDQAQAILDSPEGSLLSDRQYTRLQKQVDSTYGTHSQADPHEKPVVTKPRNLSSTEQREFSKAVSRLPKPDPGGAALQALAKNWNMPLDQAASFVP